MINGVMDSEWLAVVERLMMADALVAFGVSSFVVFVAGVVFVPVVLIRLPEDYFDVRRPRSWMATQHPVLRLAGSVIRNIVGALLLLAGLLMLVLPGQGILCVVLGLSLLDIPGKRKLEAKLIGQPAVLRAVNALRKRFDRPPLIVAGRDTEQKPNRADGESDRGHVQG